MLKGLLHLHEILNGWVWGPYTMLFLMGTGLYLTLLTRGVQIRMLARALNGLMAVPNLIAILGCSGVVVKALKDSAQRNL